MPKGCAPNHRDFHVAKNSPADVRHAGASRCRWRGFGELSQNDSSNILELPRLLQMDQRAVYLIGLHCAVLENHNRPLQFEFPGSRERRFDQSHATAQQNALSLPACERLAEKIDRPAALCFTQSARERLRVVAARCACSGIEPRGSHRAVECHPAELLPKKDLQSCDVTVTHQNARPIGEPLIKYVQKIIRPVTAARTNYGARVLALHSLQQLRRPVSGRTGEVAQRFQARRSVHWLESQPDEFLATALHP